MLLYNNEKRDIKYAYFPKFVLFHFCIFETK